MKQILTTILIFLLLLITSCSNLTENHSKDDSQATEKQEEISTEKESQINYPIEFADEEKDQFIEKYLGFWTAFEYPEVEEVTPGNYEYDWNPQTLSIYRDEVGEISIWYDVTPSLNGNRYKVTNVIQEDNTTYRINVENNDTSYEDPENHEQYTSPNTWPDIDYFIIVDKEEESECIQVKTRFRENEDIYFYSGTEQTSGYNEWLKSNGYFVDDFNEPISDKIGYGDSRVNLYEAKQIIEDYGLVFDTNIPESEWNNPKEYHFSYIIDGKEYYMSWFKCKLGTTVFFSY